MSNLNFFIENFHFVLYLDVPTAPPPPLVGMIAPPTVTTEPPMSPVTPIKGNLLADIEAGFRLRPVDTSKRGKKKLTGMAAALADALSNMREVMQPSGEYMHCTHQISLGVRTFRRYACHYSIEQYIVNDTHKYFTHS